MSSWESLREFIAERLTAAAEEILGAFGETIVRYEEEIERQRRLLQVTCSIPRVRLHRADSQTQRQVCKEEVLTDQQLCDQERTSSPDPEKAEPLQKELRASQEEEQLGLKQETDTFILTLTCNHCNADIEIPQQHVCKEERILTNQEKTSRPDQEEPEPPHIIEEHEEELCREGEPLVLKQEAFRVTPTFSESGHSERSPNSDRLSHGSSEDDSRDQTENTMLKPKKRRSISMSESPYSTAGKKSLKCDTCGKAFQHCSYLNEHLRTHTGEKPFSCKTCGKAFADFPALKCHKAAHRVDKPYTCKTCEKSFSRRDNMIVHMRIHTGEKPYACSVCGKRFKNQASHKSHLRSHTGEKPYPCDTCERRFKDMSTLKYHIMSHRGEKPYSCKTCGKRFITISNLKNHLKTHRGETSQLYRGLSTQQHH